MDERLNNEVKFVIDTNIFLEYLLDQQLKNKCEEFLRYVRFMWDRAVVSKFSIVSIVVLGHKKGVNVERLQDFVDIIDSDPNLFIEDFDYFQITNIVNLGRANNLDFDDAVVLSLAKKYNCPIVSLDKDFDKVKGVKRIEPKDMVEKFGKI